MSIFVCGKIQLSSIDDIELLELRELAFEWQRFASEQNLGFVLGAYARNAQTIIKADKNSFLFEITDAPFEETAESLFSPNGVAINGVAPTYSLEERMRFIETFLNNLFSDNRVLIITLYVNYIFGGVDAMRCIGMGQFVTTILNDYKEYNGFTPEIAYQIHR